MIFKKAIPFCLLFSSILYAEENPDIAPYRVYIVPEITYWRASENGLSFATESDSTSSIINGRAKNVEFPWDVGFKFGVGGYLPWDQWDVFLNFIHFHTTSTHEVERECGEFLLPSWTNVPCCNGFVDEASYRWRLHLGLLDVELGRKISCTKRLTLRPYMGTRTAWIRQKYRISYEGGNLFPGEEDRILMKNKFFGNGIRVGVDGYWELPKDFGLFGRAAYSLVWGTIFVHQSEKIMEAPSPFFRVIDEYMIGRSIVDLSIGAYWKTIIYQKYLLRFDVRWEQYIFPGQNQFMHFDNQTVKGSFISNQGDLTLQGVTFGVEFDF